MSEKRHELYLIAFALVISAGLILYIAFDTPEMNAVVVPDKNVASQAETPNYETGSSQDESQTQETGLSQSEIELNKSLTQPNTQAVTAAVKTEDSVTKTAGPVNINTASKELLMTLDGIGEVKAQAIIDYRRENGNFSSVDELNEVNGIGDKTMEKIRAYITM